MTATVTVLLQVRVVTQKGDRVGITGAHSALGEWDPKKIVYLKPVKSIHDSNIWSIKINIPLGIPGVEYRYVVCRRFPSYHEDEDEDCYIIRHWEAGVKPRYKSLIELGTSTEVDVYGQFDNDRKMFIDQGWLLGETEIQLRFYKDPIHMFKKQHRHRSYRVKCSTVNLLHLDLSCADARLTNAADQYFDNTVHASNPLIRVTCFGQYSNREQSGCGMSVSDTDYVTYQLRTYEHDSHGIKIDFFSDDEETPVHIGYCNILPVHLDKDCGKVVFSINGPHTFPVGQVTVRYVVVKPCFGLKCELSTSYTRYWRERPALDIGHRGVGDTHNEDFNNLSADAGYKHENTIGALQKAVESGADFVEIDVHLSRDKVPVVWHDFNVTILLRKKQRGQHKIHHIPVKELTFSHLQDLRVNYVKPDVVGEQHDDSLPDVEFNETIAPFPSLEQSLNQVDDHLGFFIELKYPQDMFDGTKEDGIESYFERNEFLDPILKVIFKAAGERRIILASFDPDICIMARLKQNRYPVMMLVWDNGTEDPYWHDTRTHKVDTAIALAKSAKFLGLCINSSCVLGDRASESLLEGALSDHMITFVWGCENNDEVTRDQLKSRGVHGVCYDDIMNKKGMNIFRAEHEEKLRKLISDLSVSLEASSSPTPSQTDQHAVCDQDSGNVTHGSGSCSSISPTGGEPKKSAVTTVSLRTQATAEYSERSLNVNGNPVKRSLSAANVAQSSPELASQAKTTQRHGTQTSQSVAGIANKAVNSGASGVMSSRPVNNVKMSHVINEDELSDFY